LRHELLTVTPAAMIKKRPVHQGMKSQHFALFGSPCLNNNLVHLSLNSSIVSRHAQNSFTSRCFRNIA
jgi:hypothetical protein